MANLRLDITSYRCMACEGEGKTLATIAHTEDCPTLPNARRQIPGPGGSTTGPLRPEHQVAWQAMDAAPRDGSMFLLHDGRSILPAFRCLKECDDDGHCDDDGGWVVVHGCPDDGGHGVNSIYHPDSLVPDRWRWAPMQEASEAAVGQKLLDELRRWCPDFASEVERGQDVIDMARGFFLSFDEMSGHCIKAWGGKDPGCSESPIEYIYQLINERDEARQQLDAERQARERAEGELRGLRHERSLIAADVRGEATDCSTPIFQCVRNLKARAERAEADIEAMGAAWEAYGAARVMLHGPDDGTVPDERTALRVANEAWEALGAAMDKPHPGAALIDELELLRDFKADIEAQHARVINEQCPGDEQHCTCVPALRRELARLRGVERLWNEQAEWSQKTFGSDIVRGPEGPIKHLMQECVEVLKDPGDEVEYADCFLLLIDAVRRAGLTWDSLVRAASAKLEVNKRREWPVATDSNAPVNHVRSDALTAPATPDAASQAETKEEA